MMTNRKWLQIKIKTVFRGQSLGHIGGFFVLGSIVAALVSGCASSGSGSTSANSSTPKGRSEVHTQLGWNYLKRGQYDVAREELDKAITADSGNSRAFHIYGLLMNAIGETKAAEKRFNRAVKLDPQNLDAQEDYAGFLCKSGRADAGLERYASVIDNARNNQVPMTRTRAGLCLLGVGKPALAEAFFRQALDADPSITTALAAMARISFETGRYLSGRGYVQRYLDIGPDDPQVLFYASNIEKELGDQDSADSYARKLRQLFPNSPEARELTAKGG